MKPIRPLICLALCLCTFATSAQWQWLDKDGRKVFSDRAPPSDIPEKNILKRPGSRGFVDPVAAPVAPPPAAAAAPAGVDKSLQEKKKQAEDAEAAKRKAADERTARMMAENCQRAQQARASLDAVGGRMSRLNEKGEREFYDEAALAAEAQRLQGIINENCK